MRNQIFILFIFPVFISCEKDLKTDVEVNPKLCFNCILNPDSVIKVSLSLSRSISATSEIQRIDGATIELKEDGKLLGHLIDKGDGKYSMANKPLIGSIYEISIIMEGYQPLFAKTRIPNKPVVSYVKSALRLQTGRGTGINYIYDVSYTIHDCLGTNRYWNYTKSKFNDKWHFYGGYGGIDSPFFDDFNKEIDATYENGFFYQYYLRINDFGFEGTSVDIKYTYYSEHIIESFFLDAEEHYDKYLKSSIKQKLNDEGSLLFNEPVQIYSNIENGLGIFGSAAITKIKL